MSYHPRFTICTKGGRRLSHLPELFSSVANFKYISILFGVNDLSTRSVDEMLNETAEFKYHLPASWPKQILSMVELFYRGDQTEELLLSKLKDFIGRLKTEFKADYYPNTQFGDHAFPRPCDRVNKIFFHGQYGKVIPSYHLKVQRRSQYAKFLSKIYDYMLNRSSLPD